MSAIATLVCATPERLSKYSQLRWNLMVESKAGITRAPLLESMPMLPRDTSPSKPCLGSVQDVGIWVKRLAQIHSGWWTTRWQHHVTRWTWKSKWSYKLIAGCGYAFVRCWRWMLCVLVLPTTWVLGARFDQLASHQCKTFGCWTVRAKFSASGRLHLCVLGWSCSSNGALTCSQCRSFFNASMTVVGLILSTRAGSRMPLPLSAISLICCLTSGK